MKLKRASEKRVFAVRSIESDQEREQIQVQAPPIEIELPWYLRMLLPAVKRLLLEGVRYAERYVLAAIEKLGRQLEERGDVHFDTDQVTDYLRQVFAAVKEAIRSL